MQIAIDTSTEYAGLAIFDNEQLIAEQTWRCGLNHTIELYPRLDALLKAGGLELASADCVYVATGPGSFNGLRVGVSAAKSIAFSLGIPIIGIGTLEYTAYQHSAAGIPVCAIQNAGREEIAAAVFQKKVRKGWSRLTEDHLTTPEKLAAGIKGPAIFCGEIDTRVEQILKKILKTGAILPSVSMRLRRPVCLANLGLLRRKAEQYDNPAVLQPLYLRKPPITERKKV